MMNAVAFVTRIFWIFTDKFNEITLQTMNCLPNLKTRVHKVMLDYKIGTHV